MAFWTRLSRVFLYGQLKSKQFFFCFVRFNEIFVFRKIGPVEYKTCQNNEQRTNILVEKYPKTHWLIVGLWKGTLKPEKLICKIFKKKNT